MRFQFPKLDNRLSWNLVHEPHKQDWRERTALAEPNKHWERAWLCAEDVATALALVIHGLDGSYRWPTESPTECLREHCYINHFQIYKTCGLPWPSIVDPLSKSAGVKICSTVPWPGQKKDCTVSQSLPSNTLAQTFSRRLISVLPL